MRCDQLEELLDYYLDNDLSEEGRAKVERHVLRCPDCAFRVRALEQTRALLRGAYSPAEASPSFRERMSARLEDDLADVLRHEPVEDSRQRILSFPA